MLHSLYKDKNPIKILAWLLVYCGILPIFIDNAFTIPSAILTPLLLAGLTAMLVGFGLLWRLRE